MTDVTAQPVTFTSQGETLAGNFYSPRSGSTGPAPTIIVTGPMTYQKEQAPTLYAERLSARGYATLVFDPRYRGQSGGQPRNYENPQAKVQDLRAALDYLESRDDIDSERMDCWVSVWARRTWWSPLRRIHAYGQRP